MCFRNHKSAILTNKKTCELAVQYIEHKISEISFILIEKITSHGDTAHIDRSLLTRESYWTTQLCTLSSMGLTKDANSDLKIASAIILNKRITTYRVIKFFEMNRGNVAVCAFLPVTFIFYLILNVIYFIFVMIKSIKS